MAQTKFDVKRMKIGDFPVQNIKRISFSDNGFDFSIEIKDITVEFTVPVADINKCLAHFNSVKKQTPFQYQRQTLQTSDDDIICFEVVTSCARKILAALNAAKPGAKIQLLPDGSRIATKYIIFAVKKLSKETAEECRDLFPAPEDEQPSKYRELSATGLNLILQDFNKELNKEKEKAALESGKNTTVVRTIPAITKSPKPAVKKVFQNAPRPDSACEGESDFEGNGDYYGRCNIRDTKKIFDILGKKYAKVSLTRLSSDKFEKYRRKRLGGDLRKLHPPVKRTNLGKSPVISRTDSSTRSSSPARTSPPPKSKHPPAKRPSQSKDSEGSRGGVKSASSPIVLLEAGAFSVGPYKGIGLCNVELGTSSLKLHFSSQATPLQQLGSAMVIHTDNVVHIEAHVSPLHTSVIFFYLAPPFAAVLCSYLHAHAHFSSYRKDDCFNSYGVIAVVLQPVTESRGVKFRTVCETIGAKRGGATIMHEIDAEGAGKHLKVCFSSALEDALATTDQKISLLPPIKDDSDVPPVTAAAPLTPAPNNPPPAPAPAAFSAAASVAAPHMAAPNAAAPHMTLPNVAASNMVQNLPVTNMVQSEHPVAVTQAGDRNLFREMLSQQMNSGVPPTGNGSQNSGAVSVEFQNNGNSGAQPFITAIQPLGAGGVQNLPANMPPAPVVPAQVPAVQNVMNTGVFPQSMVPHTMTSAVNVGPMATSQTVVGAAHNVQAGVQQGRTISPAEIRSASSPVINITPGGAAHTVASPHNPPQLNTQAINQNGIPQSIANTISTQPNTIAFSNVGQNAVSNPSYANLPKTTDSNPVATQSFHAQPITIEPVVITPQSPQNENRLATGSGNSAVMLRCPFGLKPMQRVLRNVLCSHNYDEASVRAAVRAQGETLQCPVIGCTNMQPVRLADLTHNADLQRLIDQAGQ